MDELVIEDKKYISGKRAAKLTGYAKDYIGQLCREGRVPARLVGRSWYVLESAIQDHRFGAGEEKQSSIVSLAEPKASSFAHTWEPPRYEAAAVNQLFSVKRSMPEEPSQAPEDPAPEESKDTGTLLSEAWKEWFMHAKVEDDERVADEEEEVPESRPEAAAPEEQSISVPIRPVYTQQSGPVQPDIAVLRAPAHELQQGVATPHAKAKINRAHYPLLRISALAVGVIAIIISIVGTGVLGSYVNSYSQASVITGVTIYEK